MAFRTPNKKGQSLYANPSFWTWSGSIRNPVWGQSFVPFYDTYEQYTLSHPYDRRAGGYREGGPWYLKRQKWLEVVPTRNVTGTFGYHGNLTAHWVWISPAADPAPLSVEQMWALGATSVARSLPTNPSFSLATFLGELREGLPHIMGSTLKDRTKDLRSAGDEYLNVEFGWKPLMNDLTGFAKAVKTANATIRQYERDSNRKIRRRYAIPDAIVAAPVQIASGGFYPSSFNIVGQVTYQSTRTVQSAFEGAFRYHIPVGDRARDKFLRYESFANRILGTRLTPEVVWNLAPWSWAIDWFTNAGDVMHNISTLGADGLVMEYGYQMRSDTILDSILQESFSDRSIFAKATRERVIKQRENSNPYGFGVTNSSLSARQLAILSALGLSRSKG